MPTYKIMLLLFLVNGAPIILCKLLDRRYDWPVDGGHHGCDNKRLLGPSKTWRGIFGALLTGSLASYLMGVGAVLGLAVAALAMLGDVFSSFVKRRLDIPSSGMALGLDQIPEALLPLLWLKAQLHFGYGKVLWLAFAFVVLELAASKVLYRLKIRKQPY